MAMTMDDAMTKWFDQPKTILNKLMIIFEYTRFYC